MKERPCPACRKPRDAGAAACPHCGHTSATQSRTIPSAGAGESRTHAVGAEVVAAAALPERLGPYAVLRELGRGGMGRVLEAVDEPLGRRVAVKILLATTQNDGRRRFIEEARIAGGLEHPGIAPIYSLGRAPDGSEYFSMKLVAGRALSDILKDRERGDAAVLREYSLPRLLSIFERVVETIAYAHTRRILHRDLKPGNIMVGQHGEVWVLDWGLAKAIGKDDPPPAQTAITARPGAAPDITTPGAFVGTPQYMAPEQAKGHALDARTDVFGLGGILYRMLTGTSPNQGPDYMGTVMAAAIGEVPTVRATANGRRAPVALAAIADKCLAGKPDDRYASANALLADVRAYAAGEAIRAQPDGLGGRLLRFARRHHRAAAVAGLLVALLLVGWTLLATVIAAKDRRTLELEREAQAAEVARQAAVREAVARSERRMRAFAPYAEATDLLQRGQLFDQAAKRLEEAVQIDPEFPEAQFALGEALRLGGTPARAAPAYLKANELSRQITGKPHLQALLAAGMAYDGAGEYDRSEQSFIQAERDGAGHPLSLVGKAFRLAHERKLKEARTAAEEALRKGPHLWETHMACGFVLQELIEMGIVPAEANRNQAIAHLRKALELSPRQAETCVWLARVLYHSNTADHRSEGLRLFDHAIALEPRNGNRHVSRAIIRLASGNAQTAALDIQKARELGAARPLLLYVDSVVAAQKQDYETAFRLSGELVKETREWPPHVGNWVALGFQLKRDGEVRGRFEEWCKANPDYPETHALRAQIKARDSDFVGAVADDRAGLKIAPWNAKLRSQLAIHLAFARKWQEALTAADAALATPHNEFMVQTIRVRCLVEVGRGADAVALLDQLQKNYPPRAKEVDELRRKLADRLPK